MTIYTFANTTKVPNPFAHHHDDHGDHGHDHGHGHGHGHGDGHGEVPHGRSRPKVEYNTITTFLDHKNLYTYFE